MNLLIKRTLYTSGFLLCLPLLPASAAQWKICDLTVRVQKPQNSQHLLFTKVLTVKTKNNAECPNVDDMLNFDPETEDYQSMIPRKYWPKPNTTVAVKYRYLDGNCKDIGPCRIKHYSLMKK